MGVTLSGSQGLSSPQANGYVGDVMIPPKKFMKVAAFGVHAVNFLMLLQRLSPAIIRFLIQEVWSWFQDVAVQSSGIVTTSRYVVPTGRVKVPAGRYVVPTGKDNVIVSVGRSKVISACRTILVLVFVKAVRMHAVPPLITGTFIPPSNNPNLDDTQVTYGSKSNNYFDTNSVSNDFVSCDNSDKSSDSETTDFASCVSSVKSSSYKTNEPIASAPSSVAFQSMSQTADQQPSSTNDNSSFSFK
ncbi:hypothetical protein Tco_0895082 [Tanacetum coccineum]|uniref:Uncharacterized protein n=1 Tax=Tanacetum coccineum TaxID=301880 RepID=A0ABQ5CDY7_9ASTR